MILWEEEFKMKSSEERLEEKSSPPKSPARLKGRGQPRPRLPTLSTNTSRRSVGHRQENPPSPHETRRASFAPEVTEQDIRYRDQNDPYMRDPTDTPSLRENSERRDQCRDRSSRRGQRHYHPREEEVQDGKDMLRRHRIYTKGLRRKASILPIDITELTYEIIDRKTFLLPEGPEYILDVVKRAFCYC